MAWQNGKKINGLWAINENRNAWAHVSDKGWRKMANNHDTVTMVMMIMATHAKAQNRNVNFREDGNMIKEMYVW